MMPESKRSISSSGSLDRQLAGRLQRHRTDVVEQRGVEMLGGIARSRGAPGMSVLGQLLDGEVAGITAPRRGKGGPRHCRESGLGGRVVGDLHLGIAHPDRVADQ